MTGTVPLYDRLVQALGRAITPYRVHAPSRMSMRTSRARGSMQGLLSPTAVDGAAVDTATGLVLRARLDPPGLRRL